jgi:hypothetical protein
MRRKVMTMRTLAAFIVCLIACLVAVPALADGYPVRGKWGVSASSQDGPIDCAGKRIISFNGNQRQDSGGGVPAFRNRSVSPEGPSRYRVVDVFSNGQINNAHSTYVLHVVDDNHLEMTMQPGGTLKLQRCR